MAMTIGGNAIPTSIENKGKYLFKHPEETGKNGLGEPVLGLFSSITWTFPNLTFAEFDWWLQSLLVNQKFRRFTSAQFYDDTRNLITYSHCIVKRPTFEHIRAANYENVTIQIDQIA